MNIGNRVVLFFKKNFYNLFFLSLFLIKIPPFYIFPFFKSSLLTTQSVASLISFALFAHLVFRQIGGEEIHKKKDKVILALFLVYFIFQSISIFPASNTISFLKQYKNLFFPGIFLFIAIYLKEKKEKIALVFVYAAVFNFFYQFTMFFFPSFFTDVAGLFVPGAHLELVEINLGRGRVFVETYDEASIPFIYYLFSRKKKKHLFLFVLLAMVAFPSLISNFRTRMLMLVFAFFSSFLFLSKRKISFKLSLISIFLVFTLVSELVVRNISGFSFVDRFAFEDKREDVETVEQRILNINRSFDIGKAFPLTGVGLGNYYEYVSTTKKHIFSLFQWISEESDTASTNPHNIFAQMISETGIFSFLFYVGLLGYFAKDDLDKLKAKSQSIDKAFVVSFWTLFIYSVFNPTTTLAYNSLFWVIRGIL